MPDLIEFFRSMSFPAAILWCLVTNFALFVISVAGGELVAYCFRNRRCAAEAGPLTKQEILLSISCVLLNSLVMLTGVMLMQRGIVEVLPFGSLARVARDVIAFLFVMDVAMYALHRVAHIRWIYPWVHQTHHDYENPRPLTLFVLNPFEVLGFGLLWLLVICIYPSTGYGMACYLALNLMFGTMGHLGVEPFPDSWDESFTWWISTSSFHARHHSEPGTNFGFYTLFWDYLFGTLAPKK